jgi:site-specific DNA recombinase
MKRRSKMMRDPEGKYAQVYSNTSYFSNAFYCGECSSPVVRRRLTSERNGEKYLYTAWQCRVKVHPKKYNIKCSGRHVWEEALEREDNNNSSVSGAYEATIRHLYYEQEMLQAELDELNEKQQGSHHLAKQLNKLLMYLDELEERTEDQPFRADIFKQTVQRGIIYKNHDATIEFKCGISRKVRATRVKEEE